MNTLTCGLNPLFYIMSSHAHFYTKDDLEKGNSTPDGRVPYGKFAVAANYGIPGTGFRVLMSPILGTQAEAIVEMDCISADPVLVAEVAQLASVPRFEMFRRAG